MSISPKLREDGSGGAESPWAADLDGVSVTVDYNGRQSQGGTPSVQIDSNGRIACSTDSATGGAGAWGGAGATFSDGVVRALIRSSHAGISGSYSNTAVIGLRKAANNGNQVALRLQIGHGSATTAYVAYTPPFTKLAASEVAKTFVSDTDYECVFVAIGSAYKWMIYAVGAFPPGSDYKTPTWDWSGTDATPTTQNGRVNVGMTHNQTALPTVSFDNLLAFDATEDADVFTVAASPGDGQVTLSLAGTDATQKRAVLWRFIKYKSGSAPAADASDGTLITGAGTGLGGSAIRSDGRFLDIPADFAVGSLSNGTTYYFRPFHVQADGSIVAGAAQAATPSGSDTTPPTPPADFAAVYADPFVDSRIDLTGTQPLEAGDYKINYRDDGVDPTDSADASATTLVDWTAYASEDPIAESATGLTDGTRYRFAIWNKDAAANISAGAFAQRVAVHQIDSATFVPADAATGVQQSPYLQWDSEAGIAEDDIPIHWRVEVSTDESSEANFVAARLVDVSSLADGVAGFEFEDSADVWVQLPDAGLAAADVAKSVRYRAGDLDTTGQYFWRVRPQQPGS